MGITGRTDGYGTAATSQLGESCCVALPAYLAEGHRLISSPITCTPLCQVAIPSHGLHPLVLKEFEAVYGLSFDQKSGARGLLDEALRLMPTDTHTLPRPDYLVGEKQRKQLS